MRCFRLLAPRFQRFARRLPAGLLGRRLLPLGLLLVLVGSSPASAQVSETFPEAQPSSSEADANVFVVEASDSVILAAQPYARDSTPVRARSFAPDRLAAYRGESEFNYARTPSKAKTLWGQVQAWLKDLLRSVSYGGRQFGIFEILGYLLVIAALALIILRGFPVGSLFQQGRSKPGRPDFKVAEEDIHGTDLTALLERAIEAGDYRAIIRYRYLWLLRHLDNGGLITWQPEKTNARYVAEVQPTPALARPFEQVTGLYERVWYGGFPATAHLAEQSRRLAEQIVASVQAPVAS